MIVIHERLCLAEYSVFARGMIGRNVHCLLQRVVGPGTVCTGCFFKQFTFVWD